MIIDIGNQVNLFLTSILLGVMTGIYFDIYRILRKSIKHSRFYINLEDFLFWVVTTFVFYYVFLHKNNGDIRGYILLGFGTGFILEILLISKVFIKIGVKAVTFLVKIFREIFTLILQPIRFLCKMVRRLLTPVVKKSKSVAIEKYNNAKRRTKEKFKDPSDFK